MCMIIITSNIGLKAVGDDVDDDDYYDDHNMNAKNKHTAIILYEVTWV